MLFSVSYRRLILAVCILGLSSAIPAFADDPPSTVGPVIKLFQSGRLPAERQATVVEMICNRGNEHDLRVIFDKVVAPDGFGAELRMKAMGWLGDAASTRKIKPAGDLAALDQLVGAKEPALQLAAIRLATAWKVKSIEKSLQALALNEKVSPELQRAAIEGLVAVGDAGSKETLVKLAATGRPHVVRMLAVAGLIGIDLPFAASQGAAVLAEATPEDNPAEMLDAFFNRKDGSDRLADAIKARKPHVDVAKSALRYMYSVGRSDPALSGVLSEAAGIASDAPPPTPQQVAEIVSEVNAKGNAARGEKIFRRADVSCMRCHSVSRAGGQVGPDLSAVGGSSPVDYVVNSILNPNLAVKEQYVTKVFALVNGTVLTGVVIDRDDTRVRIRDVQGKTITIPTADIDEEVEGKSLMPQGLTKFMTRGELLDLAKFISELGKPGDFEIRKTLSIQRWRVLRKPAKELTAEVPHLEHIRQFILGSPPEDWASVYAKVAGVLPLSELRVGKTPVVLILQGEVQVNEAGKLAFKVSSTEKFQAWIDTEAFESKTDIEASLETGRHTITLRVEVSGSESPELKVDVVKPEGSTVQFEVIGGS
jgi:putative heme-binding domain-containing protein